MAAPNTRCLSAWTRREAMRSGRARWPFSEQALIRRVGARRRRLDFIWISKVRCSRRLNGYAHKTGSEDASGAQDGGEALMVNGPQKLYSQISKHNQNRTVRGGVLGSAGAPLGSRLEAPRTDSNYKTSTALSSSPLALVFLLDRRADTSSRKASKATFTSVGHPFAAAFLASTMLSFVALQLVRAQVHTVRT